MMRCEWSGRLRKAAHVLMYGVLGLMAFAEWEVRGLTPAELLLGVTAGIWGLALVLDPKGFVPVLKELRRYWAMGLFVGWMVVCACFAEMKGMAWVKVVQWGEYFVVAVVLLHDFFATNRRRVVRGMWILLGVMGIFVAVAMWQYFGDLEGESPFGVRGLFKHANVLGGYLALLVPVCFGVLCEVRRWWVRLVMGALVVCGLMVTLSGAAYVAMVLAMAGIGAARGARCFVATCVFLMVWQVVVMEQLAARDWMRENVAEHLASAAIYEDDGEPAPRYPEWQAGIYMMTDEPVVGVGPGHYQRKIGQYYGMIPRSPRPKDESDVEIQNQYLVLGATMGLPGVLAFLAMVVSALIGGRGWRRGLAGGAAAGVLAFAGVLVWHPLIVRGVALVFVALLVVCHALREAKPRDDNNGKRGC